MAAGFAALLVVEGTIDFVGQEVGQLVLELAIRRVARVPRTCQINTDIFLDAARARGKDDDPVSQRNRFLDRVRYQNDRGAAIAPDLQEEVLHFGAGL